MINIDKMSAEQIHDITQKRNYCAIKNNDLIRKQKYKMGKGAGESLTLLEQKTLLYIISQLKPMDTELKEQTLNIREFCNVCGFTYSGSNYEIIKDTISKLKSRVFWIYDEEKEVCVSWIEKAVIYKKSGNIKIKLDNDLIPYLLMLQRNYTKIPIFNIVRMKSKYGIALYELLQSYIFNFDTVTFSVSGLKQYLDCENYENFANFRRKVIDTALKDINTYSNIKCTYAAIKKGRTYTHITFFIEDVSNSNENIKRTYNVLSEIEPGTVYYMTDEEEI